jgi:hypothetical protein
MYGENSGNQRQGKETDEHQVEPAPSKLNPLREQYLSRPEHDNCQEKQPQGQQFWQVELILY